MEVHVHNGTGGRRHTERYKPRVESVEESTVGEKHGTHRPAQPGTQPGKQLHQGNNASGNVTNEEFSQVTNVFRTRHTRKRQCSGASPRGAPAPHCGLEGELLCDSCEGSGCVWFWPGFQCHCRPEGRVLGNCQVDSRSERNLWAVLGLKAVRAASEV